LRGEQVPGKFEIKFVKKNGEAGWCIVTIAPANYKGKVAGVVSALDITERKRAETALRESEEKFRVLSETSPAAIFMYQGDKLVYANPAAEGFTGFTKEEMLRKNFWDMVHPAYRDMVKKYGRDRQRGRVVPPRYEVQYINRHGETRWAVFAAGPIEYRGKPGGIVIALDITDHKQAEAALMDSKAQAELYVDLMGHDINNLNQVALGYLELAIERLALDDKTRELIEKPIEALEKSSGLIRKVKKLQLMRSGALEPMTMDVGKVLDDVVGLYANVPDREVLIKYKYAAALVKANELLTDVFSNLVMNAIKHSPCDRPLVIDICMANVREDRVDYFKVTIDDNGPGIPDKKKASVFGRFARGKDNVKGGGLGLYLVKSLVEKYGGKVWVEDRVPGDHTRGCRFVVMLPAADQPRDIDL
jgi:PAS domain S-box-containing protein